VPARWPGEALLRASRIIWQAFDRIEEAINERDAFPVWGPGRVPRGIWISPRQKKISRCLK